MRHELAAYIENSFRVIKLIKALRWCHQSFMHYHNENIIIFEICIELAIRSLSLLLDCWFSGRCDEGAMD